MNNANSRLGRLAMLSQIADNQDHTQQAGLDSLLGIATKMYGLPSEMNELNAMADQKDAQAIQTMLGMATMLPDSDPRKAMLNQASMHIVARQYGINLDDPSSAAKPHGAFGPGDIPPVDPTAPAQPVMALMDGGTNMPDFSRTPSAIPPNSQPMQPGVFVPPGMTAPPTLQNLQPQTPLSPLNNLWQMYRAFTSP